MFCRFWVWADVCQEGIKVFYNEAGVFVQVDGSMAKEALLEPDCGSWDWCRNKTGICNIHMIKCMTDVLLRPTPQVSRHHTTHWSTNCMNNVSSSFVEDCTGNKHASKELANASWNVWNLIEECLHQDFSQRVTNHCATSKSWHIDHIFKQQACSHYLHHYHLHWFWQCYVNYHAVEIYGH